MGLTKKCPFCAENIQYKALVCKHCGKELPKVKGLLENLSDNKKMAEKEEKLKIEKMTEKEKQEYFAKKKYDKTTTTLWGFIFIVTFLLWFKIGYLAFLVPLIGIWFHPKREEKIFINRFKNIKKEKARIFLSIVVAVVILAFAGNQILHKIELNNKAEEQKIIKEYPVPEITILSSKEPQGDNLTYLLEFEAKDTETAKVNGDVIEEKEGRYTTEIKLKRIKTPIEIIAKNKYKSKEENIIIERNENSEEKQARLQKEAELAKQEADRAAEQAQWEASKAGQLCNKYSWSKDDCESVANNKYWIGMSYEMLVEERGKPDSANPSDYGYGTQWQWCWYKHTPMCFYDNDDDKIIDSFN